MQKSTHRRKITEEEQQTLDRRRRIARVASCRLQAAGTGEEKWKDKKWSGGRDNAIKREK